VPGAGAGRSRCAGRYLRVLGTLGFWASLLRCPCSATSVSWLVSTVGGGCMVASRLDFCAGFGLRVAGCEPGVPEVLCGRVCAGGEDIPFKLVRRE
jgi:hypothetical protein